MDKKIQNLKLIADTIFDAPMSEYTSFKAGGKADALVIPKNERELSAVLEYINETGIPSYVLGRGSNILVRDGGYHGAIVKLGEGFDKIKVQGTIIEAGSGVLLAQLAKEAQRNGLTGLEFASGIPGSLGGAMYMNAGAYGGEMKQIVKSCKVITKDGRGIKDIPVSEMELGYRESKFMHTADVVISAVLELEKGDRDEIAAKMKELGAKRNTKQPVQYPSAGSTFKRPEGYYAGKLVQDAGMQGVSVGGAQVSTLHAGFIINTGDATASDIVTLIHLVQAKVKEKFDVYLEPEVRIIGEESNGENDI